MIQLKPFLRKIRLWVLILMLVNSLSFLPILPAQAGNPITDALESIQRFIRAKPKATSSGKKKAGAGRGGRCTTDSQIPLIALAPNSEQPFSKREGEEAQPVISYVGGYTTQGYPTFWFYVPYAPSQGEGFVKLMLLDEEKTPLFGKALQFSLAGTPGIIGVSLPAQDATGKPIPPLQIGKSYSWYFSVVCDLTRPSKSPDVNGWIERINVVDPDKKTAAWYDALDAVISEYSSNSVGTQKDWKAFLSATGLSDIASTKVVQCCTPRLAPLDQPF